MTRLKLLLGIALLLGMMAAVVLCFSPYAPVVQPVMPIEALWAIEDEREESEAPLVTTLECNGVPLAYDAREDVFYCTLGLDNGEEWPELHLTAPGAKGVSLVFEDDYAYDGCADAIRNNSEYWVMAYTETEYAYFRIIFTGLPLLMIEADAKIGAEDTPARVTVSAYGMEKVSSFARIHTRGGLTNGQDKKSYRVETTRRANGTGKIRQELPEIGLTDSLNLLAMPFDRSLMRDRLSWDIYAQMAPESAPFSARDSAYAEVFVNGEYEGVYLMMLPFDIADELAGAGENHVLTDSVYRTCVSYLKPDREVIAHPCRQNTGYAVYYSPSSDPGAALEDYLALLLQEDDEAFCREALAHLDLTSMLQVELFVQAGGMTDNIFNNLYIWAERRPSGFVYHFIPWDMDLSWGMKMEDIGMQYENWMFFPPADRLIRLDPDGQVRAQLAQMWKALREGPLNTQWIAARLERYMAELNDSGAMLRNAVRWETEDYAADGYPILDYAILRFELLDETIARLVLSDGGKPLFLDGTQYEGKGTAIEWSREGNGGCALGTGN